MIKQNYSLDHCFSALHFELLCLEDRGQKDSSPDHVNQCLPCRDELGEFDAFYKIFVDEIRKPISNKVLEFAGRINPEEIEYGLVMCEPVPFVNGDQGKAYQTNLIFSGNGEPARDRLANFNRAKIPQKHIAIRIMTDPSVNNLLLFLWSPDKIDFFDWMLFLPSTNENIRFNSAGAGKLSTMDVEHLNDRLIFFQAAKIVWIDKNRFETINEAIFF